MLTFVLIILLIIVVYRWITGKRSDNVSFLLGKTAIVTGGNEGIGYCIVLLLASRGCKVIIADIANAEETVERVKKLTKNKEIFSEYLDLSSFASVRKFADKIKKSENKIDILINNAGINAYRRYKTEDGLASVMQINYFGSFLLTHCILDLLKQSDQARVIFTGSILAFTNNLSVDNFSSNGIYDYSNSKYCNILAAQEFGRKLAMYNIIVNAVDPGVIRTRIFDWKDANIVYFALQSLLLIFFGNDPIVGAQSAFHLASSAEIDSKTGGYYFLCRPWLKPWRLRDPEFCDQIWKKSEEIVNLLPEEKI